jgi:hypothetical protein
MANTSRHGKKPISRPRHNGVMTSIPRRLLGLEMVAGTYELFLTHGHKQFRSSKMPAILLWLLGVPIPIIILLLLLWH